MERRHAKPDDLPRHPEGGNMVEEAEMEVEVVVDSRFHFGSPRPGVNVYVFASASVFVEGGSANER
eukprot:3238893-Amphidinium_carterae.1